MRTVGQGTRAWTMTAEEAAAFLAAGGTSSASDPSASFCISTLIMSWLTAFPSSEFGTEDGEVLSQPLPFTADSMRPRVSICRCSTVDSSEGQEPKRAAITFGAATE